LLRDREDKMENVDNKIKDVLDERNKLLSNYQKAEEVVSEIIGLTEKYQPQIKPNLLTGNIKIAGDLKQQVNENSKKINDEIKTIEDEEQKINEITKQIDRYHSQETIAIVITILVIIFALVAIFSFS